MTERVHTHTLTIHALRLPPPLPDVALVDYVGMMLLVAVTARWFPFHLNETQAIVVWFIVWLALAIALHRYFNVRTTMDRWLFR